MAQPQCLSSNRRPVTQPTPTYDGKNHSSPQTLNQSEIPMFTVPRDKRSLSVNLPKCLSGASFAYQENTNQQKAIHDNSNRRVAAFKTPILYLYFLLGIPLLYTSRVARIFKQVDVSMTEIKMMVLGASTQVQADDHILELHKNLKYSWDSFIDSLMREWRTLNVISILLLSAIFAILQIQSAADDPLTRFSALLSLICAFISVLYGCMYIIQFDSMRETPKAVEWAFDAQNNRTSIFWNVNVLLAMPLIWLVWSILLYVVCFLSLVWRTGTTEISQSPPTVTAHDILWPRIAISAIILLGLTYFVLIFTTFRRYGDALDDAWNLRVKGWLSEAHIDQPVNPRTNTMTTIGGSSGTAVEHGRKLP